LLLNSALKLEAYLCNYFFSRRVIHCWNTLPACDEDFIKEYDDDDDDVFPDSNGCCTEKWSL